MFEELKKGSIATFQGKAVRIVKIIRRTGIVKGERVNFPSIQIIAEEIKPIT